MRKSAFEQVMESRQLQLPTQNMTQPDMEALVRHLLHSPELNRYEPQRRSGWAELRDLLIPLGLVAGLGTMAYKGFRRASDAAPKIMNIVSKGPTQSEQYGTAVRNLIDSTKFDMPYQLTRKLQSLKGRMA